LETLPEGSARLAAARAAEDEYWQLTADLIRAKGGDEGVVRAYKNPFAFSGGAEANDEALDRLCVSVREAASVVGIDLSGFGARWWPDAAPNAAAACGRGGLLARLNIGLLAQLRLTLHLVCAELPRIVDGSAAGLEAGDEFRRMLDEAIGGEPAPIWWTVRVHHGAAENTRRKAMMAGLAYVLAHEIGHHAGKGRAFTQATFATSAARIPDLDYAEPQAVAAFASEMEADLTACQVLLAWGPPFKIEPFDMLVGAAAVLAIQAALFWFEAARRATSLAWTHPFPDLRIAAMHAGLLQPDDLARWRSPDPGVAQAASQTAADPRGERLVGWLEAMTGVGAFRAAALQRGLEQTGLTPAQRLAIALAYGWKSEGDRDAQ